MLLWLFDKKAGLFDERGDEEKSGPRGGGRSIN